MSEKKTFTVEVEVVVERAPEYDDIYDGDAAWIVTKVDQYALPSVDEILPESELDLL